LEREEEKREREKEVPGHLNILNANPDSFSLTLEADKNTMKKPAILNSSCWPF
jgi:hypothetical protein